MLKFHRALYHASRERQPTQHVEFAAGALRCRACWAGAEGRAADGGRGHPRRAAARDAPPDQHDPIGASRSPRNRRSGADQLRHRRHADADGLAAERTGSRFAAHATRERTTLTADACARIRAASRARRAVGCVRCVPRKRAEDSTATPSCSIWVRSRMRAPARRRGAGAARQGAGDDAGLQRCSTEILSLRGRLWKDRFDRSDGAAGAAELAARARDEYLAAYALRHDPSPASTRRRCRCCWASALRRAIWRGRSLPSSRRSLRHGAAGITRQRARRSSCSRSSIGRRKHYATAYAQAPDGAGSVASMRRQVSLLARAVPEAREILKVLPAPEVLAFAGHMIDAPDRAEPRFPAALEPAVAAALRERARAAARADPLHVGRVRRRPDLHRGSAGRRRRNKHRASVRPTGFRAHQRGAGR